MAEVAVVGATGGVGRLVLSRAVDAGHTVRAVARRPGRVDPRVGVRALACDVRDFGQVQQALAGVEVVLSCLGNDRGRAQVTHEGTLNLLRASTSVRKLVAISSVGVGDSHDQALRMSWFFTRLVAPTVLRRPLADLARMEEAMRSHPTTTVIVRPVGLTNGPACRHVIGRTVDQDVGPLVSRQDVARLMVSLVEDDRWDDQAVTVGPARGAHA